MAAHWYYFAYGSNLNSADLERYCRTWGFCPDALRFVRKAWLLDHHPVYHYRSPSRRGGALDVLPAIGHLTPGVLFAVDPEGWDLLDRKEGAPRRYARRTVYAVDTNGGLFEAMTYSVTCRHRRATHVAPTPAYAAVVENGLREHGLPIEQHAVAARGDQPTPMIRHLFIAGPQHLVDALETLLSGGTLPAGIQARCPARARGPLLELGAVSAWQPAASNDDWGEGELLSLDDSEAVLAETDPIAGWTGDGSSAPSVRVLVQVLDAGGDSVLAWSYRPARAI